MVRSDEYFAGLFDGEGTVGIYAVSNGRESGNSYWSVKLGIAGTYRPMIEAAYVHFGVGQFSTQKRQKLVATPVGTMDRFGKQGWKWHVTRRDEIAGVLVRLRPSLIEKASQVDIVLAFINGDVEGLDASMQCKRAKQFRFDKTEGEPPRRSTGSPGEKNPNARISYAMAKEIRDCVESGEKQHDICKRLGLSKYIVSRLVHGHTYQIPPQFIYSPQGLTRTVDM